MPALEEINKKSAIEGVLHWFIEYGLKYYQRPYNYFFHKAICYSLLNEKDNAFQHLEEGFKIRSLRMISMQYEPTLSNLKLDPRYKKLIDQIGA